MSVGALDWLKERLRQRRTWIIGVPVAIVVIGLLGPFVWFGVIKDDPPPPLSFDDSTSITTTTADVAPAATADQTTTTATGTRVAAERAPRAVPPAPGDVSATDGPWHVGAGSIAGYRIKETVGVTSQDAVGRTQKVTGGIVVRGATLESGSFVVDMASVESDDERRDSAYRDSMAVDRYPTATFVLAAPVTLSHVPNEFEDLVVTNVTGNLTLRGVTRSEKFDVKVRRIHGRIEVLGAIHVKFEDYEIPNPSNGYARTEDHGLVEFLLAFDRG